jgi:hypothetical protein
LGQSIATTPMDYQNISERLRSNVLTTLGDIDQLARAPRQEPTGLAQHGRDYIDYHARTPWHFARCYFSRARYRYLQLAHSRR